MLDVMKYIFACLLIAFGFAFGGAFNSSLSRDQQRTFSRQVQRCEVAGSRFSCTKQTAWYHREECGCISQGERINYDLPDL